MTVTHSRTTNRIAYDLLRCDCCGYVSRDVEPFAAGRSGLATLRAELCRRCMLRAEEALLEAIKRSEAEGAS